MIENSSKTVKEISNEKEVENLIVEENTSSNLFNTPKSEYTKKLISSVI